MNELLWILAGIALGLVIEHLLLPWAGFCARSFRPTQRLWHFPHSRRSRLMARLASDERAFRASQGTYLRGPEALRDEFDDVFEWLKEDQYTDPECEEIYLVARRWLRPRSIHGVLYATLYREFKPSRCPDKPQPMCFVTFAHVDDMPDERRLDVARDLWNLLVDEVENTDDVSSCEFFFQFPMEDGEPSDARRFYWRFLCDAADAQRVKVERAPIPDFDDNGRLTRHPAQLLHARRHSPPKTLPASDVAEFLYGALYLFAFAYQEEVSGGALERSLLRAQGLTELSEKLEKQANAKGDLELEPIGSDAVGE